MSLAELKNDQYLDAQTLSRDDEALQRVLDAAVAFVQRRRPDVDYTGSWTVPADIRLGTLRLAARWSTRGPIDLGEGGQRAGLRHLDDDLYAQLGIRR